MTQRHEDIMRESGYLPAAVIARAVGRELSTIHRWAKLGRVEVARSDRRLFLKLESVRLLYAENPVILALLDKLAEGEAT